MFHKIPEAFPAGIIQVDSEGVIKWVNKSFLEMFHIYGTDIVGQRFGDVTYCVYSFEKGCGENCQSDFCEIRQNIKEVFKDGSSRKDLVFHRTCLKGEDENAFWLKMNFISLNSSEERQILIVIEDDTKQKNYELDLQRSRDTAKSANRMKNNTLPKIIMSATSVQERLDSEKLIEVLEKLELIGESIQDNITERTLWKYNLDNTKLPVRNQTDNSCPGSPPKEAYFNSVRALPDYQLEVTMQTGSSIYFDFRSRLSTARFGSLKDEEVFRSVRTDGDYLIFQKEGRMPVRITASEFMDLVLIDRRR